MTLLAVYTSKPTLLYRLHLVSPIPRSPSWISLIVLDLEIGIDLGTVCFQAYFQDTLVGREFTILSDGQEPTYYATYLIVLSGNNLFLAPQTQTPLHLSGRIISQSGGNLDTIGTLFSHYLAGQNQSRRAGRFRTAIGFEWTCWLA